MRIPPSQISVTTGTFYVYSMRRTFRLLAEAGFEAVELVIAPEVWARGAGPALRLAREYGLHILSVHPPIVPFPGWTDIPATLPRLARFASELEAELLCVHPPDVPSENSEVALRFFDALGEARKALDASGASLALENLAHFTRKDAALWWHDPARLLSLAEAFDLPLVLDTSHADSTPLGVEGVTALFHGRIANVHLSDVRSLPRLLDRPRLHTFIKHHQLPGAGRLPLKGFVQDLVAGGYEGPFTLEISPTAAQIWCPARARARLADARRWLEAALDDATPTAVAAG